LVRETLIKSMKKSTRKISSPIHRDILHEFLYVVQSIGEEIQKILTCFDGGRVNKMWRVLTGLDGISYLWRSIWVNFCDFHDFNLTMLRKQGCGLSTNQDTVVFWIIEAWYYPVMGLLIRLWILTQNFCGMVFTLHM